MKLDVLKLTGGYGAKLILDGVECRVKSGSIVTLLGPNGCGKSTLLKMIGRILRPHFGEVLLDDKALSSFNTTDLARQLAILPQLHHAPGEVTVEELVAFGRFPHRKFGFTSSAHDKEVINRALALTRMEDLRKRPVGTLSGGERQRAWIAMTVAQEPKLLLLDEPTTFLDVCCQFEIIDMVKKLNRECGITVVMVLHDLNLAASCSNELIMMKDHKIRYSGAPAEVMTSDILRDVFEIESKISIHDGVPHCITVGSARRK